MKFNVHFRYFHRYYCTDLLLIADERSIQIPEYTDKNNPNKRQKVSTKPLFKMKIADLQSLEHDPDPDADCFKFKNHDLSLVMCGGKITDIFRDDNLFSFERKYLISSN